MNQSKFLATWAFTLAIGFGGLTSSLTAQSMWLDFKQQKAIALEVLKPDFDFEGVTFATSAVFATFYLPVSDRVSLLGELPLAHYGQEATEFFESTSNTGLGNPYFGAELHFQDSPVFAEVGLRLPLVDEDNDAAFAGIFTDAVDRMEAFAVDYIPLTAYLNYRHQGAQGFAVRLRGGPSVFIATRDNDETEYGLNYAARIWYDGNQVRIGGGFSGRFILSGEGDFSERSMHQLGFNADLLVGQSRPGVYFRLPLDEDWNDVVNFIFGLKFDVQWR